MSNLKLDDNSEDWDVPESVTEQKMRCAFKSFKNYVYHTLDTMKVTGKVVEDDTFNGNKFESKLANLFTEYLQGEYDSLIENDDKQTHTSSLPQSDWCDQGSMDSAFSNSSQLFEEHTFSIEKEISLYKQSASLMYQAQKDLECGKLLSQKKDFKYQTANCLQQSGEKLMKSLIILTNCASYDSVSHSHDLYLLADTIGYGDCKSLAFKVQDELNSLGDQSLYHFSPLSVRVRYPRAYSQGFKSKLDCRTIPHLAFSQCDFTMSIQLLDHLLKSAIDLLKDFAGLHMPLNIGIDNNHINITNHNDKNILILEKLGGAIDLAIYQILL